MRALAARYDARRLFATDADPSVKRKITKQQQRTRSKQSTTSSALVSSADDTGYCSLDAHNSVGSRSQIPSRPLDLL